MGVIAQLVVADPSRAEAVLGSDDPTTTWDGIGYKGLHHIQLITLWSLIDSGSPGDRFPERLHAVKVIVSRDEQLLGRDRSTANARCPCIRCRSVR